MVMKHHMEYLSNDHITLVHAVKWIPEGEVKAIVQICHGMTEYAERYEEFARYLAERNILVVGNDHLGHGESVRTEEDYGYFAEENGNKVLIKDIHRLRKMIQEDYPGVPYFILGHSMGSFLARQYTCCYGKGLSGAIFLGTGTIPKKVLKLGMVCLGTMAKMKGWRYQSPALNKLLNRTFNRKIENPKTDKDWLTKEEKIVNETMKDKKCQFLFTLNAYYNMLLGLYKISGESYLQKMPKELPVFFAAGGDDPVGDYGKGVLKVYSQFKEVGMKNVKCKLYPGDRHELLNETDREKVFRNLYSWLIECLEIPEETGGRH